MKTYSITVKRLMPLVTTVIIETDGDEGAAQAKLQHQLEAEQCSQLDDDEVWGAAFRNALGCRTIYSDEIEMIHCEEVPE